MAMNDSDSLPKFSSPPVVETVLAVYFRPIEGFETAHQAVFWDRFLREGFPSVEERPPLDQPVESFDDELNFGGPHVRWQVSDRPPAPRLWASSSDGDSVVQLQKDAFLSNWRKTSSGAPYKPFDQRRNDFAKNLDCLAHYLGKLGVDGVSAAAWQVTYINHLPSGAKCQVSPALANALTFWQNRKNGEFLPDPESVEVRLAFPMPDHSGRLHIHVTPAVRRRDNRHILRMDLTARGNISGEHRDIDSAMRMIDLGHEWVVRGFASITNPQEQQRWGRIQ